MMLISRFNFWYISSFIISLLVALPIITVFFGPYYMSMLYGWAFFVHQIGSFFGSWFGGRLFDIYGSYDLMWWICVILGIVAALLHMPIIEKPVERLQNQKT